MFPHQSEHNKVVIIYKVKVNIKERYLKVLSSEMDPAEIRLIR